LFIVTILNAKLSLFALCPFHQNSKHDYGTAQVETGQWINCEERKQLKNRNSVENPLSAASRLRQKYSNNLIINVSGTNNFRNNVNTLYYKNDS